MLNFDYVLKDRDDKDVTDPADPKRPLTVRLVLSNVLLYDIPEEGQQTLPGPEKYRRADMGLAIYKGEPIELKADDIAMLKKLVGKAYGGIVVLQVWKLLDAEATIKN